MNDLLLRVLAVVLSGVSPELCWNGRNTALFGSILLPDWKRLMPDDTDTLQKILEYAEKRAIVPQPSGTEQIAPNATEDNTVRIAQQNKF